MTQSQLEVLEEMLRWLRFSGMQKAKEVIENSLTFEEDERKQRDARIAYELTDGDHTKTAISRHITYSRVTVGNWQEKWSKLGIVNEDQETGNFRHLISLEELGLDCPSIPEPEENSSDEE